MIEPSPDSASFDSLDPSSEPSLDRYSGTVPVRKSSARPNLPQAVVLPDLASGEATREYSPDEFANLLRSAHELASRRSTPEAKPSGVDTAQQSGEAGDTTRVYSPDEFSCLVSSVRALTASAASLQTPVNNLPDSERRASSAEFDRSLVGLATTQVTTRIRQRRHRRVGVLLAACLATCAVLFVVALASHGNRLRPFLPSHAAPRESVVASDISSNPSASRQSRLVRLSIEINPPEAQLFVDGESASNPLQMAYPNDDAIHEIRGEAPGYLARATSLKFDRDVLVVLSLVRVSADELETGE